MFENQEINDKFNSHPRYEFNTLKISDLNRVADFLSGQIRVRVCRVYRINRLFFLPFARKIKKNVT